ncbi:mitochondrial proton/calcium exchanger protein [Eupeodes corollae]|uniref:mitochondrial proton/calcium exchanger protein n=1 Tax=Eupeodes corollae TaxID=290404 RepID=UPI00248FD1F6|nr:mitochondrial proton/calcium exchanger protein [Eupeodes corollae]XP_055903082.1 mitochondrial proton/calcium exchanger protein [Eupeodes corollae]XP_055903083.1 mitochondrial proton/calcium exchanger protein [Eupeodes corollae]
MNFLIRQQKAVFKFGLKSPVGFSNKYTRPHHRSIIAHQQIKKYSYIHLGGGGRVLPASTTCCNPDDGWKTAGNSNLYAHDPFGRQIRYISVSSRLSEQSSSKVEETVKLMKNKQKEQEELIKKENLQIRTSAPEIPKPVPVKKSLKQRIWDEIVHYYHGFRLLFIDINICRKLLGRVLNGKTLTRRENKLLVRTTSDLFRLIPFSIFIIVPFMELLLPVFIKFFPGMLPSTFQTNQDIEDKLKHNLKVRLEMAKFLQKTLDEMSVQHSDHNSEEAKAFAEFFQKIKDPNEFVDSEDIIKFSKQFQDEITLDSLSREQLVALCRVLELQTMATTNLLRFQLRLKLRSLAADDRDIAREGVNALDLFELQQACKTRGMRAYGLSAEKLRSQLQEWIDLSLNEKVPNTLLLLSRALMISDDASTTHKLKETIRVLPDVLGTQTKAAIGEREGKIDNKTKIEIIKEEERKIKEERDEEREEEKQKAEELLDKAPKIGSKEPLIMSASEPLAKKPAAAAASDNTLSPNDVKLLGEALKTVVGKSKQLLVEKETIKDLKEEIEDYKEDLEELREITTTQTELKESVKESRGAKILFKKVNSMIGQLDKVLNDLEQKGKKLQQVDVAPDLRPKPDALIRVDELVNAIKLMQETSDEAKLNTIEKVLSKIDVDQDGAISAKEVLKVVEIIGRENVKLSEKLVEELLDLLDKEEIIETEEKIEKAIAKSIKEADNAMRVAEEIQDMAPLLEDKAKDLDAADEKNLLVDALKKTEKGEVSSDSKTETILPKTHPGISSTLTPPISPPPSNPQANPKDKML